MTTVLDGKALAARINLELKQALAKIKEKIGIGIILVGNNPSSEVYVSGKLKAAKDIGMETKKIIFSDKVSQQELMQAVDDFNQDKSIHGYIVQLPLPSHIDKQFIIDGILPHKDADGFSPVNLGSMFIGKKVILPATPKGIMRILSEYKIQLKGKHAVVVGRSDIVGKPISFLLQQADATVTMCHSQTEHLEEHVKRADILVSAVGRPHFISAKIVKKGAVVIDVGTTRIDGKLVGDVHPDVMQIASAMTPVPGGIGPMTIAMLLENVLDCYHLGK